MSPTSKVAFAPQVVLEELVSDEDFELFGIDPKTISDEAYAISIGNQSGHYYVIHGTPYQLQKFVARLMTMVRSITHDNDEDGDL